MHRIGTSSLAALVVVALASGYLACGSSSDRSGFDDNGTDGGAVGEAGGGTFDDAGGGPGTVGADGCSDAAKLVYVVDTDNGLHSFNPGALKFTSIGTLSCPSPGVDEQGNPAQPNSMAVDRTGTAWVNFSSGKLYKVSTSNAACSATTFKANQHNFVKFGMGFSSNASGSKDETLFVEGIKDTSGGVVGQGLATIDLGSMILTPVGDFTNGLSQQGAELTGTGEGKLYGFFTTQTARLAEIDKSTAATPSATQKTLTGVSTGNAWAFSFWGGDFWFYTSNDDPKNGGKSGDTTNVTRLKASGDGSIQVVLPQIGFRIVGAGVSTCAPVTPPK